MFFENEYISFRIIDVLEIDQKNVKSENSGRNFDALSFRFYTDVTVKTDSQTIKAENNTVYFFPARVDYLRQGAYDCLIAVHMDVQNYFSGEIEPLKLKNPRRVGELFKEIYRTWCDMEVGYKYKCSAILNEIFSECYKEAYNEESIPESIRPSVEYLRANITNPTLTIAETAKKSYISQVYFRKLFKETYGISPTKYIISARIQNAVGLMSTGYYTLAEVAEMSGYTDYAYFSTEFKRIKGASPSEYLKKDFEL